MALFEETLEALSKEREGYDRRSAIRGQWSEAVVQQIAEENPYLSGRSQKLYLSDAAKIDIEDSFDFLRPQNKGAELFFGEYLLQGKYPPYQVPKAGK